VLLDTIITKKNVFFGPSPILLKLCSVNPDYSGSEFWLLVYIHLAFQKVNMPFFLEIFYMQFMFLKYWKQQKLIGHSIPESKSDRIHYHYSQCFKINPEKVQFWEGALFTSKRLKATLFLKKNFEWSSSKGACGVWRNFLKKKVDFFFSLWCR